MKTAFDASLNHKIDMLCLVIMVLLLLLSLSASSAALSGPITTSYLCSSVTSSGSRGKTFSPSNWYSCTKQDHGHSDHPDDFRFHLHLYRASRLGANRREKRDLDSDKVDAWIWDLLLCGDKPPKDRTDGLHRKGDQREEQSSSNKMKPIDSYFS